LFRDPETERLVGGGEGAAAGGLSCAREDAADGTDELQPTVGVALDRPTALVDEPVVRPAQPGEVGGVGGAVVAGPPGDVVQMSDLPLAPGEPTAVVAV